MCRSAASRTARLELGARGMKLILALIRRDLTLSMRQGGGVGTALGFFLTVVVLLPIGIGPDQALLARIAPGALWISLLLSVLLSADRIYQQDYEDGSLDIMTMGPVPFEMVALAKAVAHWLSTSLPLAIAAPHPRLPRQPRARGHPAARRWPWCWARSRCRCWPRSARR